MNINNPELFNSEYKERFDLLNKVTQNAVWDWDIDKQSLWCNDEAKLLFGHNGEGDVTDLSWFFKKIHPSDKERVVNSIRLCFNSGNKDWNEDFLIQKNDGTYVLYSNKGYLQQLDSKGRFVVSMTAVSTLHNNKITDSEAATFQDEALNACDIGTFNFYTATGKVICSDSCKDIIGLSDVEIVDLDLLFSIVHPNDKEYVNNVFLQLVEKKENRNLNIECRIIVPDTKNQKWVNVRCCAFFNNAGIPIRCTGTLQDITEKKRAEQHLQNSEERFRTVFDNASVGMTILTLNGRFIQVNPVFCNLLQYSEAELLQKDFLSITHPADIDNSINEHQKIILGEVPEFVQEKRYVKKDGSSVWAQVWVSVIKDTNNKPKNIITILHEITTEKKAKKEQEKLSTLIQNSVDFIAMGNLSGQVTFINKGGREMLGIKSELQALNTPIVEYYGKQDSELFTNTIMPALSRGERFAGEICFKHFETGEPVPVFANCFGINDAETGELISIATVSRDLRKEKEVEIELNEREKLLRTITSASPAALWMSDEEGMITFVNQTWLQMTGLSFEESLGSGWTNAILEEDRKRAVEKFLSDLKSQKYHEVDFRILNLVGEVRWCLANGLPQYKEDGSFVGYIGSCTDITERKLAEQASKESADRFMFMANAMPQMVWTATANGEVNYYNQLWLNYTGLSSAELHGWGWQKVIHPDDLEQSVDKWKEALAKGRAFEMKHRFLKHDGTYRWHLTRSMPQFDDNGNVLLWVGTNTDINDQKEAEEFLILQARVLEIMDEGVSVADENGVILYTNIAIEKMFGCEPSALIGNHITIQFKNNEGEGNIAFTDVMVQLNKKGYWNGEWKNTKKDGTPFTTFAHVTSLVIDNKKLLVCIQRDITEERRIQVALDYQNKLTKTIADNATSTLFMMDKTGYCTFMNPAGEKMFGYTFDEIRQQPLHYMIHHHRPDGTFYRLEDCPIDRALPENFDIRAHEDLFFRKDGSSFPVSCAASPIFENNIPVATVIEVRDITVQKEAEEALLRSADILEKRVNERTHELLETNELLQKSNSDLEQFAYIASHDLQEPLRKIQIFADRLHTVAGSQLQPASAVWLLKIQTAAQRMSTLIKDLLDYSRLSRKSFEQEFTVIDLNEVLVNIQNDLELAIQQKQATINSATLPKIEAVELQMNQLFYNLISNSLKFSPANRKPHISIVVEKVTDEEKTLHHLGGKDYCKILFSDNGIGFNQDFANQKFVIFKRLNTRDKFPGTGIGLALCKKVVDNHLGVIYAHGQEGVGATFTIILPIHHHA